ncbi:hypothetical protein [Pseudoprimorskyibacter insulae]|uniref:Methyl-accepting transducer domain-containing protein n=1 Tax=Pseudoprimorskyibacter insulae TaxID=1695997 RepID=A0A2R8ANI8_9RHOB|nr:hypothetical protein [Pseudoprimorskyibacter insulae]SPF77593.1 hypothetical protein PRI8871_00176 [Pseudoprimorskyibacter insulae]
MTMKTASITGPMGQIETVFTTVLDDLFYASQTGHRLRGTISDLASALGAERLEQLEDQRNALSERVDAIRREVGQATGFVDGVARNSRRMGHHLKELNENIQSANIVALNARIIAQGHRHLPQGDQMVRLSADISEITDVANRQVSEMFEVMDQTERAIAVISESVDHRSNDFSTNLLPRLEELSTLQDALYQGMGVSRKSANWLGTYTDYLAGAVAEIIGALQAGDRACQRMTHVIQIRDEARRYPSNTPERQALDMLSGMQLAHTTKAAYEDVVRALELLDNVLKGLPDLDTNCAAVLKVFDNGRLRSLRSESIEMSNITDQLPQEARQAFATLKECDDNLREHSDKLGNAAFQMQLTSINTIIACARVGGHAADMIVISQQINEVISAVPEIFAKFAEALDDTKAHLAGSEIAAHMQEEEAAHRIDLAALSHSQKVVVRSLPGLGTDSRTIIQTLESARKTLKHYKDALGEEWSRVRGKMSATLPAGLEVNEGFKATLNKLRKQYSMAEERDLHDLVFADLVGAPKPTKAPAKPAPAEDDLSAILF